MPANGAPDAVTTAKLLPVMNARKVVNVEAGHNWGSNSTGQEKVGQLILRPRDRRSPFIADEKLTLLALSGSGVLH